MEETIMATTRLMAMHIAKGKTAARSIREKIDYVINPAKTEKGELVTSYECDQKTAASEFALMRKTYLMEHRPVLFSNLLLSEKLYPHLREIDETAQSRLETMMPKLMEAAGISEKLKAENPMQWVGLMNNCKAQAEETILRELVYS